MEHNHSHNNDINLGNAFKISITINIIFIVVEAFYGFFSHSMALVADAGHNFSDVLALVFSWVAVILSQRKPTLRVTYGFRRSTILIALVNTIVLLVAVAFIMWETIERLSEPTVINTNSVIIVAAIGVAVNGVTAWLFLKGKKHDLNIRSAFLQFIADALVSLGVVVQVLLWHLQALFGSIHWCRLPSLPLSYTVLTNRYSVYYQYSAPVT